MELALITAQQVADALREDTAVALRDEEFIFFHIL